jgi:hypothetical protein
LDVAPARHRDTQRATADAQNAAMAEQRKKFDDEKFDERYKKVQDASTKQTQALGAWTAAKSDTEADRMFYAWLDSVYACLNAVSDYDSTARKYPVDWFSFPRQPPST